MRALRIPLVLIGLVAVPAAALAQAVGISPDGKKGRIHTVTKGDTLWDITETYLGTPWAWPSIWKENDILNPHRIHPGEMIWITEGEMRKLTPEEAERFMRAAAEAGELPAAPDRAAVPGFAEPDTHPDPFAALDSSDSTVERYVELKDLHRHGFVTVEEEMRGGGTIMGAHRPNYWSAQHQRTIVSMGEGQTQVGDMYTIYRVRRPLRHPDTGEMLGYLVEVLGKGEVGEVHPEASFLDIIASYAEIQPGDRVVRYVDDPENIREVFSDALVDGSIVAYEPYRLRGGRGDLVILDKGVEDGVAIGRRFSLYRAGREVRDPATLTPVLVPDDVIGEAFVVKSSARASLALVTNATTELLIGDRFRNPR
jgi:hypothetical protein